MTVQKDCKHVIHITQEVYLDNSMNNDTTQGINHHFLPLLSKQKILKTGTIKLIS
jgi:hypothetical protein